MPEVYAPVGVKTDEPFVTFYQVFVGPRTAFEPLDGAQKIRIPSIIDGAANTIAIVEAGKPVPWTKPDDLAFQPAGPLPNLGGLFKDGFNAAFVDASVLFVAWGADRKEQERLLKALITRNGGEPVTRDQLRQVALGRQIIDGGVVVKPKVPDQLKKVAGAEQQSNKPGTAASHGPTAQLGLARDAFRVIEAMRATGQGVSERDVYEWSVRLMNAERDSARTKAETIAAVEAHTTRMKDEKALVHGLHESGQVDGLQILEATYRYNEAMSWLEKARKETAQKAGQ
jgi:hypothetical protein